LTFSAKNEKITVMIRKTDLLSFSLAVALVFVFTRGIIPLLGVFWMKNKKRCHFLRCHFLLALILIGFTMTACQEPEEIPPLTGTVSISGNAHVGQTLTANTTNFSGSGTVSYQWKRRTGDGASFDIGTNSVIYVVQTADLGSTITVTVSCSGNSGSVTSDPTDAVILPPLTVTVTITGTTLPGEMLTANITGFDGGGDITFQWMRDETINIGGNSNTYILQDDDDGHTITVIVTCSGNTGSITSKPTSTIGLPPLTGTVRITGTALAGQTLTAYTTNLRGSGDITFQWMRDETTNIGGNSNTYIVQADDVGYTITVTVTCSDNSGSITSNPTAAVELPPLTGSVTITGTTQTGRTLTANTAYLGGSGNITFQWMRDETTNIGGNSSTYIVQADDLGSTITVTVTRSGYAGGITSNPTSAVTLSPLTGTVRIDGNAWVGQTLTANTTNLGGSGTITYQWILGGTGDGAAINIGTDSSTYIVQADDLGSTITVTVTRPGYSGSVTSIPTAAVILPPLTGTVSISGIAEIGQTLTADTTNLGGSGTISYQWKRRYENIGTDSNTYVIQAADEGFYITVTVTRAGNSGSVRSNAVSFGLSPYEESVRKVEFTESTVTVTIDNLSNNDVYLVKVNKSASTVNSGSTGSVQSVSLSSSNGGQSSPLSRDELPRKGHPAATAFNANPPPIVSASASETFMPLADFIPPEVGDTRMYYVETYFNSGKFEQRQATLLATGQYGNIWVMNNGITTVQAQEMARNFDLIYPAETNILGFEYGGGTNGNGGKDGDPKIQILVYNFGSANVLGFFWGKDFYDYQTGSNKAEIFYLNSTWVSSSPELLYLTLAHEFQHMINFNRKYVENGRNTATWYDETLSMMAEDIMANILDIPTTHADHPIQDHIPYFIETYDKVGFTEWPNSPYPYSKGYTFGAYLMRNYGGAELLKKILDNDTVNIASLTAALNEIEPGLTFEKVVSRFGEAMIFSGDSIPEDTLTFDKTVTTTVTAHNGTHTYTLLGFDIWTMKRYSSSSIGPVVYSLAQRTMRGHSVLLHQDPAWKDISGSVTITLNKPSSANVEFYLMVR
jgi:hypothetical protein